MLSIVLMIVIWTCNLMPLWANIICTVLLVIRFIFRLFITIVRFMNDIKDNTLKCEEQKYQEEQYYIKSEAEEA